ncbi:hypothetical protein AwEntero_14630 [Enterobacterales bacterium]|nr:hypothetical protein AwEntero_14630 [Enterobacterales bacterium]
MLFDAMGVAGMTDFVRASAGSWLNSLILLVSLIIVLVECRAAYAMMRGRNWGRWAFIGCQAVVVSYMLLASFEWFGPKIFRFETDSQGEFLSALLMQKIPDIVVILLLFVPPVSRRFFLRRR